GQQAEMHERLNEFSAELARAHVARAEQEQRVRYLESLQKTSEGRNTAPPALVALEAKRAEMIGRYRADSERMKAMDEEIARLRAALAGYDGVAGVDATAGGRGRGGGLAGGGGERGGGAEGQGGSARAGKGPLPERARVHRRADPRPPPPRAPGQARRGGLPFVRPDGRGVARVERARTEQAPAPADHR